ncbi:MAG: hypothetical protein FJY80_14610 [Candidatus Aminicenantes bacterium]|nr:hypothetical protein [Candidatus Aminicenantes bacterium]MBM3312727.1 hypothetical protein [Candidatus Aminicenantes bacterium]
MKNVILTVFVGVLAAACVPDAPAPHLGLAFPCTWPTSPGFAPTADIDRTSIGEPSGLIYHPFRKTLFVISDQGEIFEIRTDGEPVGRWPVPGDLEGLTVDPGTGLLYVVIEGEDVVLEFDPERGAVLRRFPISRAFGGDPEFLRRSTPYDNGIESIAFVPDPGHPEGGAFYAGNQEDPSCLLELIVPLKSGGEAGGPARIVRVLKTELQDPAGMYYDERSGLLNVVCDAPNIFLEVRLDGTVVRAYAFPGNDQEGVCVDPEGFIYIAQDSGGILKLKDLRPR